MSALYIIIIKSLLCSEWCQIINMHQIAEYLQKPSTHAHLSCQNFSLSSYIPSAALPLLLYYLWSGSFSAGSGMRKGWSSEYQVLIISNLANVSVRCTGILQGEDEDGQCIWLKRRQSYLQFKTRNLENHPFLHYFTQISRVDW